MMYAKGIALIVAGMIAGVALVIEFGPASAAADTKPELAQWTQVADGYSQAFKLYQTRLGNGDVCYTNGGALACKFDD